MHGPSSEPEQPALATAGWRPSHSSSAVTSVHRHALPRQLVYSALWARFHVPRLITSCSNRPVPPTRLVARSEKQQQPSPSKYNIVIPPSLCILTIFNPSASGVALRFLLLAASYSTPPRPVFVSLFFPSSFFITPRCSFACIDPTEPDLSIFFVSAAAPTPILC